MKTTVRLSLTMLTMAFCILPVIAHGGDAAVSGTFKGNGQEAKLAYAIARKGDPYDGKPTTQILLSEKDPGKEQDIRTALMTGALGSTLLIKIAEGGKLIGTEVAHAAHAKKPFSSVGTTKLEGLKMDATSVQGTVSTDGEQKFFDQTWEMKLSFKAKRRSQ